MNDINTDVKILSRWHDLIKYQLKIAESWLSKGDQTNDDFAKFFFYFTGFNALYFLWKKIDNINHIEKNHIDNLLKKFSNHLIIFNQIKDNVNYFSNRRPISQMNRREASNSDTGNLEEGSKWQRKLKETCDPLENIIAIGQILYLVRCNLVHGSKADSGDDEFIIKASIQPLKVFLAESIKLTRKSLKRSKM